MRTSFVGMVFCCGNYEGDIVGERWDRRDVGLGFGSGFGEAHELGEGGNRLGQDSGSGVDRGAQSANGVDGLGEEGDGHSGGLEGSWR